MSVLARLRLVICAALVAVLCVPAFAFAAVVDGSPAHYGWLRLWGQNAYATMNEIVDEGFAGETCSTVVLASGDGYWDALTASGLAGVYDSPILLTGAYELNDLTRAKIASLNASKVVVVGGKAAVSDAVTGYLEATGYEVERLSGDNAAQTALKVYEKGTWGSMGIAIIATGSGYHDALASAPLSYSAHIPIFLAQVPAKQGTNLDDATVAALKAGGFTEVVICGGAESVSPDVEKQLSSMSVKRIAGENAPQTSMLFAEYCLHCGMKAEGVAVASTSGYWDALSGAALCGKLGSPLLLVWPDAEERALEGFVNSHRDTLEYGYIFGGEGSISAKTEQALTIGAQAWEVFGK